MKVFKEQAVIASRSPVSVQWTALKPPRTRPCRKQATGDVESWWGQTEGEGSKGLTFKNQNPLGSPKRIYCQHKMDTNNLALRLTATLGLAREFTTLRNVEEPETEFHPTSIC